MTILNHLNGDDSNHPLEKKAPAAPGGGPITGRGTRWSAFGPAFEGGMDGLLIFCLEVYY